MHVIRMKPFFTALATAVVAMAAPLPVAAQQVSASLAGAWKLNPDKTGEMEDERIDEVQAATSGTSRRIPGTRSSTPSGAFSRGGDGGSAGGRGGGCRSGGTPAQMLLCDVERPIEALIILQDDSTVTFDRGTGRLVKAHLNGKAEDQVLSDGSVHRIKATWKKDELVVERQYAGFGSTRETFHLDRNDPKLLLVDFHFENKRERHTMDQKRAYMMAAAP